MSYSKIPFDLKFCKLEHNNWNREDTKTLAYQLLKQQETRRFSIENRITIAFDKSETSSTLFFRCNEAIMLIKMMEMIRNPEKYWHSLHMDEKEVLACVILIKEDEYIKSSEISEFEPGDGMREEDKAIFAHKFLADMTWLTDKIEVHPNPKEHGIDAYIYLPQSLVDHTKCNIVKFM